MWNCLAYLLIGLNDEKLVVQNFAGKLRVLSFSKCIFCCDFKSSALLTVLYTAWCKSWKPDTSNKCKIQFCWLYTFRLILYLTILNSSKLVDIIILPILSTILLFLLYFHYRHYQSISAKNCWVTFMFKIFSTTKGKDTLGDVEKTQFCKNLHFFFK